MAATQIESFCERCGTKYAFEQPGQRGRVLKGLGRTLGILGDDVPHEHETAVASRDPFHGVFRFCLECRQYTCPSCWNEQAGFCQGCVPLPESPDMGDFEAAAAMEAATHVHDALAELRTLGTVEAWPDADLPQLEPLVEVAAVAEPEPELEPVIEVAAAEPELAAVPLASGNGVVVDTDELFAGPWDEFAAAAEPTEDIAPTEEWAALTPPPVQAEPEPEPEPVAELPIAAVAEPAPVVEVAAVAEPEPEPVVELPIAAMAEPEPEPEPEPVAELPVAAMAEPEPEPEPVAELPIAAMAAQLVPAPHIEPTPAVIAEPSTIAPYVAPASRLAAIFGRGRKPAQEPTPAATPEPRLASGWRVTAPDEAVWPPHAPVYEPPRAPAQAAPMPARPSLLSPRSMGHQAAGAAPSGIRPCYQCALPLSATARFCRRCGTPQQPGA